MQPRTAEDIKSRAPLKVTFGIAEYSIKPLTLKPSGEWREKLLAVMLSTHEALKVPVATDGTPESLLLAASTAPGLREVPQKLADLVFAYAPELPREEILNTADDAQIMNAFRGILSMCYPFFPFLVYITQLAKGQVPEGLPL